MYSHTIKATRRIDFSQFVVGLTGIGLIFTGAALLFAPHWFYQTIGTFPPFNRHYAGDLGSFQLPLGIAMLVAARRPSRHMLLLWAVAGGSLLHAFNHAYDALIQGAPLSHWFADTAPLLVLAVLLIAAVRRPQRLSRI